MERKLRIDTHIDNRNFNLIFIGICNHCGEIYSIHLPAKLSENNKFMTDLLFNFNETHFEEKHNHIRITKTNSKLNHASLN